MSTNKNTRAGPSHAHSDDDDSIIQSKIRKKLKNKNKRPVQSSTPQPVSLVTDIHRTNPQSPNQVAAESFEDEESEDDMFVDAPEFPESKSFGITSERSIVTDRNSHDHTPSTTSTGTVDRSMKRVPKSSLPRNTRSKNDESRSSNTSKKTSRTTLNNRIDLNSGGSSGDGGKPTKRTQITRARSTDDTTNDKSTRNKSLKPVNNSDCPINRSISTIGTRGSYVAYVDNDEDENEAWNQMEPGSDWNNDDKHEGTCTCTCYM